MRLKMYQIFEFEDFCDKIKDIKLSIKTAYKLSKIAEELKSEKSFYTKRIESIVNEYGEKDENGNLLYTDDGGVKITSINLDKCNKEINELSMLDISISDIFFRIDEFKEVNLTLKEIASIMPFINGEDNE